MASTSAIPEADRKRIGQALKRARVAKGYKRLPDLAPLLGMSSKTLGKVEAGVAVDESTLITVQQHLPDWPQYLDGTVGAPAQRDYVRQDDVTLAEAVRLLRRAVADNARVAQTLSDAVHQVARAIDEDDGE